MTRKRPSRRSITPASGSARPSASGPRSAKTPPAGRIARGRPAARPAKSGAADPQPAQRSKLASLVSELKSKVTHRRASARPQAASSASARTLPPVAKRSVVRTPARGPSPRTKRPSPAKALRIPQVPPAPRPAVPPAQTALSVETPPVAPGMPASSVSRFGEAPARALAPEEQYSIPSGYGDHRIVVMVKDPWWIFAYWEIQPQLERSIRSQLIPQEVVGLQTILRVYDVTGRDYPSESAQGWFDISLSGLAMSWYIQTNAPGRSFVVEIGLLTTGGRFLMLARSNRITAPAFGPSDVVDEAWMTTDEAYWKLFGATAGVGIGSSQGGAPLTPQQLFSGNWSSGSFSVPGRAAAVRGFWCRVNTDLVIHGATEPKASVTIQGQPVPVRKDGTFSLRLAMPEGTQTIAIEAISPDGQQSRTLTQVLALARSGSIVPDGLKPAPQQLGQSSETYEPGRGARS